MFRLSFYLLPEFGDQIRGRTADMPTAPILLNRSTSWRRSRIDNGHDRGLVGHRPVIETVARKVVVEVRIPRERKYEVRLPAVLRNLKAPPALQCLQSAGTSSSKPPRTNAVHIDSIGSHDLSRQNGALGFLGEQCGNARSHKTEDRKKPYQPSHK
jgi:hypothetical protein